MEVCILGWFGHGNAGDERIGEVLIRCSGDMHFTLLPFLPLPPEIVNWFDAVILTAGNWHPRHRLATEFHRWCRKIHVPIVGLGLGVERMTPELAAGSAALVERCDLLWVRDPESRRLLGDHQKILVGPDVTWLDPWPPVAAAARSQPAQIALNLRPWSRDDWRPGDWVAATRSLAGSTIAPWPLSAEDWKLLNRFYRDLANDFDLAVARGARIVVGMRLHSLIFAAQLGLPAIGISYDPKCERFLDGLGRREWALPLDAPERLREAVAAALAEWDQEHRRLLTLRETFREQAAEILDSAVEIFHAAGQGRRRRDPGLLSRALVWLGRRAIATGYALRSRRFPIIEVPR